jgi:hypothetical protein
MLLVKNVICLRRMARHYQNVDEETTDEDTTVNKSYYAEDTWTRDLYHIADPTLPDGATINFIKVYARCRNYEGGATQTALKLAIKTGGTAYESSEITITGSYVNYSNQWTNNPQTDNPWTKSEIASLQVGINMRRSKPSYGISYCTQAWVEVDYTSATEKSSSDSGSGVDAKASGNPLASIDRSETGSGAESLPARGIALPDAGYGVDVYVSLQTPQAKTSSDAGSGAEGTPMSCATLAGSETGSGIETFVARLLAAFDSAYGVEAVVEVGGQLKNLLATELGEGSDSLTAKIEMPTKGGGMKLWT